MVTAQPIREFPIDSLVVPLAATAPNKDPPKQLAPKKSLGPVLKAESLRGSGRLNMREIIGFRLLEQEEEKAAAAKEEKNAAAAAAAVAEANKKAAAAAAAKAAAAEEEEKNGGSEAPEAPEDGIQGKIPVGSGTADDVKNLKQTRVGYGGKVQLIQDLAKLTYYKEAPVYKDAPVKEKKWEARFATGMNGDEDFAGDFFRKGQSSHY
jgi:uncharacterized protein (DUF2147 family)